LLFISYFTRPASRQWQPKAATADWGQRNGRHLSWCRPEILPN